MRCLLLAFALGVLALQQQPELPARAWAACTLAPLLIALLGAVGARRLHGRSRQVARGVAMIGLATAVALAGFFYAAWRAEVRLADELPPAWEGRDIEVRGVIDEMPQPVDRGARFAFAVERVPPATRSCRRASRSPGTRLPDGDAPGGEVPELHAGERWPITVRLKRPHGTVNPHGFDLEAWLLAERLRRHRLRAGGRREPPARCVRRASPETTLSGCASRFAMRMLARSTAGPTPA